MQRSLVMAFAILSLSACSHVSLLSPKSEGQPSATTSPANTSSANTKPANTSAGTTSGAAAWTYTGKEGPDHWGKLSSDYAACSSGRNQSPINLQGAKKEHLANISFSYKPSKITLLNNGHTIQADYSPGSSITVDGVIYYLLQFHFHEPSEHLINGTGAAAELHLVHRSADGDYAVVGVLIRKGSVNKTAERFWSKLPTALGQSVDLGNRTINVASFLPAARTTYRYAGSLTTPPCDEGVKWMVMTQPITFSEQQLAEYRHIFKSATNRPVQQLNSRAVVLDSSR